MGDIQVAQGSIWNSFAPISVVAEPFFGWTDGTLALLANWGAICYLLAAAPSAYLLDVYGLRTASPCNPPQKRRIGGGRKSRYYESSKYY